MQVEEKTHRGGLELLSERLKRQAAERRAAVLESNRDLSSVRLLGWDDLKAKGIDDSKATIYKKIKVGKFPAPVYPGKSPAWPEHEIDAHILSLIAKRDGERDDPHR